MIRMNKLSEEFVKDSLKTKDMSLNESIEYMATGSIIAYMNGREHKWGCDLHGPLTAQIKLVFDCIDAISKERNVYPEEILKHLYDMFEIDENLL